MFNIGPMEFAVIMVVALLVIGPQKLPEVLRTVGRWMGEFKRMSSEVKSQFEMEVQRAESEDRQEKIKKELFDDKKGKETSAAAEAKASDKDTAS